MRQLVYALRFLGQAKTIGIDGKVLKTATSAPGCAIRTRVGTAGLSGSFRPIPGDEATVESELIFTGATTFQEAGTIRFGTGGHRLRFSTIGSAYLGPAEDDERRQGMAIWQVDGGDGQFAGASGLIASAFFLGDAGEVTGHHLGVVLVR